jgi:DNA-binding NtrC family response regulator
MHEVQECRPTEALLGDSQVIQRICDQLQKAALTEVPVLITGEGGTGKELAARLLHNLSSRRSHNFLKINCPSIPKHTFESELFGHKPEAVAGAEEAKPGNLALADMGTLFLDEITDLDLALQRQLLHALQDFRAPRADSGNDRLINIRLICATSQDIEVEVKKGLFRTDLFHRINVLRIHMPSLRERSSDVPILVNHFISLYGVRFGVTPEPLRPSFMRFLQSYHWPGNIRQLENLAKRYVVLGREEHVISVLGRDKEIFPWDGGVMDLTTPLRVQTKRAVQNLEREIIMAVLQAHNWNRRKAAHSLDISYSSLLQKIKQAGLPTGLATKSKLHRLSFREDAEIPETNDFR